MRQRPPIRSNAPSASPLLQRALQLQQLGKLNEAERLYAQILATQPLNFEALRRRGVLLFQQGRNEEAVRSLSAAVGVAPTHAATWSDCGVVQASLGRLEDAVACYDKAIALDPGNADALSNRGNALVGLKRPHDALASYERALAVKPRFLAALNNRGGLLCELGRPAEALATLEKALAIKPDYADALSNRGNALVDLGRAEEAVASYGKALAINPACANAHNNRGNALVKLGRPGEALASYQQALALNPANAEAWCNGSQALRELKRYDEALAYANKALSLAPNYGKAFNSLANTFLDLKRPAEALAAYEKAIAGKPDFVEALTNRAKALIDLSRSEEAVASCDAAIALKPDFAEAHNNRGAALANLGREEEAIASYDLAIALKPDYAAAHDNKGVALLQLGRFEEAGAAHEAAIKLAPTRGRSHHHLALSKRFERGDQRFEAMEDLARETSPLDASERVYVHFALGKAYSDVGDHERSFRHFSQGGALKRQQIGYDEAQVLGEFGRTRATCTREFMARGYGCGEPSPVPVFIVGMPRSGTTLIEQVLASHPDVHGAGEIHDLENAVTDLGGVASQAMRRPDIAGQLSGEEFRRIGANYLARISAAAPAARRIVNKMPENFRFAGLIALALPNARIIHVRRDPVDTCVSCFSTLFAENLPYTYDLAELGRYYRGYEGLMDYWRGALPPGLMIDVQYEDVVADLEGQGRRILAHCGLGWDARCLDFHRNERSVRTASVAQVRRPLYQSSVGRWRRYEAFLGPLLAALDQPSPSAVAA